MMLSIKLSKEPKEIKGGLELGAHVGWDGLSN